MRVGTREAGPRGKQFKGKKEGGGSQVKSIVRAGNCRFLHEFAILNCSLLPVLPTDHRPWPFAIVPVRSYYLARSLPGLSPESFIASCQTVRPPFGAGHVERIRLTITWRQR